MLKGCNFGVEAVLLLMMSMLHCHKGPKLWEVWYIPCYESCRIYILNPKP